MPVPPFSAEIAVIGAGPAGCAAARRLALLGHDVLLIDRGGPGRPAVIESAPATLPALLGGLGCAADASAGVSAAGGSSVRWGNAREEPGGAGPCLIDRPRFDAALRQAALAAGVRGLVAAARAPQAWADGRWHIPLHDAHAVLAQAVLTTGGGAGPGVGDQPRTAALCGVWHGTAPGRPRTVVEAGPNGWAWAADAGEGRAVAVVFVDTDELAGVGTTVRFERYLAGLATCPDVQALLAGAAPPRSVRVADATPRHADPVTAEGLLRAGDAAHRLDPLSAQGVVAALRGGAQVAVALHTALRRPADAALAWRFLREQQQRERQRHRGWCAASYRAAGERWQTAFWGQRSKNASVGAGDSPQAHVHDAPGPPPPLSHPVVLDARARLDIGPRLEGEWIMPASVLDHPGLSAPIGFVAGQPVASLARHACHPQPLGQLLGVWRDALGAAPAVALAQAWWRAGLLVGIDSPRREDARPGPFLL